MSILTKNGIIIVGLSLSFAIAKAQNVPPPPGNNDPVVAASTNSGGVNDSWKPTLRKDGVIDRVEHAGLVTPWQPIREADVMWKKRVWREVDTRQKQNYPFRYPGDDESGGGYYIEILMDAIKQAKITAFSDDRFTIPLTAEDVLSKVVGKPDTQDVELPDGTIQRRIINKGFNPDAVTKFRLKEDWIFDRNVGRMVCRIIGVSPILDVYDPTTGLFRGTQPMFWLYYPDIRNLHAKYEIYNPDNDIYRITWDDYFEKRMFSSYITKSSIDNPFAADISAKSGIDKLYEGELIKEKLFNKEHDMWVE